MSLKSFVVFVLFLGGCAGAPPLGGSPAIQVLDAAQLPPPQALGQSGEIPYRIGPADKLNIAVLDLPDVSQKDIIVDGGGMISLPLAGTLEVGGRTTSEVVQEITARLRSAHVRNPEVSVNIEEATSHHVTVEGQVKQPGLYPIVGKMSLMRAVAAAKGANEFAKLDDVVIFRTVDGRKMAALYNLSAIQRGAYEDPAIYGNDIVVVGESKARRLFASILQAVPLLTTPLVVLLQNRKK